jgi:hypothetical protein
MQKELADLKKQQIKGASYEVKSVVESVADANGKVSRVAVRKQKKQSLYPWFNRNQPSG